MKKLDIKFVLIFLLFCGACYYSWNLYFKLYLQKDTVDIHLFPQKIGEWISEELPITDEEYAILETRNVFVRKYKNSSGDEVDLFMVYSQNNRKVSHPPEVCYLGSGVSVLKKAEKTISLAEENIIVNQLLLERGSFQQASLYWFKVGDSFTQSYWKQQVLIALKTLLGQSSSSALIRISAPVVDEEVLPAVKNMKVFLQLMMPEVSNYLP